MLTVTGEKVSADEAAFDKFKARKIGNLNSHLLIFSSLNRRFILIGSIGMSYQEYNADEAALYIKMMPSKSIVLQSESVDFFLDCLLFLKPHRSLHRFW